MANIPSYQEFLATGQFSSEPNCAQYLIDMKILPTHRRCPCGSPMTIRSCPISKYRIGSCWKCDTCLTTTSLRSGSCLQNSNLSFKSFIDVLDKFSSNSTVTEAASQLSLSEGAVRRVYKVIREQIAEDVETSPKIGGPGAVVEIDEAKFGKRKFNTGRLVDGVWVCGGIERHTDNCFLEICEGNRRNATVLGDLIRKHVHPGTNVITDKWKGYVNLSQLGYIHLDVNHSENFVDPLTGAHTNTIEGTWTHAKQKTLRRGGRRTVDSFAMDLSEFMWRKQRGLLCGTDRYRRMFSRELPSLLNYRRF